MLSRELGRSAFPCQSGPSALSRSWTASAATCRAQGRAAVSMASKSGAPSRQRLSSASISARMATANAVREFLVRVGRCGGQPGIAQPLADLDQFAGQAAQTIAFVLLSARWGDACGGDRAGGLADAGLAIEQDKKYARGQGPPRAGSGRRACRSACTSRAGVLGSSRQGKRVRCGSGRIVTPGRVCQGGRAWGLLSNGRGPCSAC